MNAKEFRRVASQAMNWRQINFSWHLSSSAVISSMCRSSTSQCDGCPSWWKSPSRRFVDSTKITTPLSTALRWWLGFSLSSKRSHLLSAKDEKCSLSTNLYAVSFSSRLSLWIYFQKKVDGVILNSALLGEIITLSSSGKRSSRPITETASWRGTKKATKGTEALSRSWKNQCMSESLMRRIRIVMRVGTCIITWMYLIIQSLDRAWNDEWHSYLILTSNRDWQESG